MKFEIHPITVEAANGEVHLMQARPGEAAARITLSPEQIESLCEMLFRVRKALWQEYAGEEAAKDIPAEKDDPFGKARKAGDGA